MGLATQPPESRGFPNEDREHGGPLPTGHDVQCDVPPGYASPRTAWGNAAAFIAHHLAQRATRTPRNISDAIAWAWAPSTLTTYRSRITALGQLATSLDAVPTAGHVVEQFLLQQLGNGAPAASLRLTLSAATFLHTMGFIHEPPPARLWKLSTAALRLQEHEPDRRWWAHPSDMLQAAQRAACLSHWQTLAISIVALSLGLRIGEAALLCPSSFLLSNNDGGPSITFRGEKSRPGSASNHTRRPPPYVFFWAAYLHLVNPDLATDKPFCSSAQLRADFGHLFPPGYTFHALRRGCARGMFQADCPLEDIMLWIRWSDKRTALHYIGTPPTLDAHAWTLPLPPCNGDTTRTAWGSPADFWPIPQSPLRLGSPPHASNKRTRCT